MAVECEHDPIALEVEEDGYFMVYCELCDAVGASGWLFWEKGD